jgi:hypothetical protein
MYYGMGVALHPARAQKKIYIAQKKKYEYVLCHKRRAASSARAKKKYISMYYVISVALHRARAQSRVEFRPQGRIVAFLLQRATRTSEKSVL